ncbi:hypothetical protein FOG26_03255 [Staphylococcus cohnii]|uniref:nuclear transport factor 2 family protein n=1 Tax=Staphylococcus cohnii TaxID=29382 RepID=UPI001CCE87F3|nr:nuclear transport factor 2 family protein [Staphylococcus cohnii]MBZ8172194.1 hypothetical protein [Staphylococcus cohnii]
MLKKDIASLLSMGKFYEASSYLSKEVKWNIVNDIELNGFTEVERYFESVSEYFDTVVTNFVIDEVIENKDKVVVVGTAEFYRDAKLLNVIEACDVYLFENNKVKELKSFCIPLDKFNNK